MEARLENPRMEIIGLMRGFYALPIISFLGHSGALQRMTAEPFSADDFADLMQTERLPSIFRYLTRLGLLSEDHDDTFVVTALGSSVFKRHGSFSVVRSYEEYFRTLESQLHTNPDTYSPRVNRRLNVLGSGQNHGRKFFGPALEMVSEAGCDILVDVGCGDGAFAAAMAERHSGLRVIAVDASSDALDETAARFRTQSPSTMVQMVLSDAADTNTWLEQVKPAEDCRLLISFWFLLHEVASTGIPMVRKLLDSVHQQLPRAEIIIGEMLDGGANAIAANRASSAMPEYLLFHELSGQRPFTFEEINDLIGASPYTTRASRQFDLIEHGEQVVPSSVVLHLEPTTNWPPANLAHEPHAHSGVARPSSLERPRVSLHSPSMRNV